MFCPFCGTEVPNDKHWCPNCGANLEEEKDSDGGRGPIPTSVGDTSQAGFGSAVAGSDIPGTISVDRSNVAADSSELGSAYTLSAQDENTAVSDPMPDPGSSVLFIVIGFVCGVIWGVIAYVQYKDMKKAVELGDAELANKKAHTIKVVTIVGVVINLLSIVGLMSARG